MWRPRWNKETEGRTKMNNENTNQLTEAEAALVKKMVSVENLFVILSTRTSVPFVLCDPETFDDQVLVFDKPENVHKALEALKGENNPIDVAVIHQKDRLNFFANLCTMGVNCVVFDAYSETEESIQLERMVKTPKGKTPDGMPWIENPSLYLTAIYFMQAVARNVKREETPELTEMREEIVAHYSKGNFIIAFNEKGQLPIMRFPNGDAYQPIFTDMFEATKFKADQPFKIGAVPSAKLPGFLSPEAKGIVINPNSVCLQLPIIRKAPQPQQAPAQNPAEAPAPTEKQER